MVDTFTVDAAVSALLPKEEANKVAPKLTCTTCQGKGVYLSHSEGDRKEPAVELECYTCDGRGWV